MAKLSEYELERERNIARNKLLLQQLDLQGAASSLGASSSSGAKAKPVQPVKKEKRKREPEVEQPRRQSARLRKSVVDPNETPAKRRKREREEEKQRAKEEEEKLQLEEERRKASRPRHDKLNLINLVEGAGAEESSTLSAAMENIKKDVKRSVPDFEDYVYDDEDEENKEVEELRKKLSGMKVHARAKVTKSRIYSAAYHPEVTKDLIFFGDKEGALGIWDARAPVEDEDDAEIAANEEKGGGKYWRIQLHWPATAKSSISSIKIDPVDPHNLYTSSYDTTVRELNFTTGQSREIYASDDLISCIDVTPSGREMWLSDTAGWVTHIDLREPNEKRKSFAFSDQKVGSVSINPAYPHILATASNNRTVKVWDVRKLDALVSEMVDDKDAAQEEQSNTTYVDWASVSQYIGTDDGASALRADWNHDKSATAAAWDPRGKRLVSTSYDDNIRIWDWDKKVFKADEKFPSSRPITKIRHSCQTGKWVTPLKAHWTQNPDVYPYFTVGSMDHSLDIFSAKGEALVRLSDPRRISAVQAVTCSHPSIVERAVSGNGSGRCVLWAPEDI
ncbi:WD40-repeat-containing domain protein [Coprinopsis sp. MPI-PUGE-AT-0042]|nr:WD40-repeat-containing domain protein [Coprinopsis sp. MPI-PUGE-AT-0042]